MLQFHCHRSTCLHDLTTHGGDNYSGSSCHEPGCDCCKILNKPETEADACVVRDKLVVT